MAATLIMSLGGGFITHYLVQRGALGKKILRDARSTQIKTIGDVFKQVWQSIVARLSAVFNPNRVPPMAVDIGIYTAQLQTVALKDSHGGSGIPKDQHSIVSNTNPIEAPSCGSSVEELVPREEVVKNPKSDFWKRLGKETWTATTMVIKFMLLAWFVGALIRLYVPEDWITSTLGGENSWAIITASFLGIPVYTSNMAAMPLVGGLLAQGMHPGAALAFLIAGPTTTLPAMSAVWGIVNRRIFGLYIGFSLVGAVIFGYIFNLFL
jgi:uncharacterized membrane protein YraQ (UPF0718 family)